MILTLRYKRKKELAGTNVGCRGFWAKETAHTETSRSEFLPKFSLLKEPLNTGSVV